MRPLTPLLLLAAFVLCPASGFAQRGLLPSQHVAQEPVAAVDPSLPESAQQRIREMVLSHPSLAGLEVQISIGKPTRNIGECGQGLEFAFASPQGRPWGAFQVVVRCNKPAWTLGVPVQTRVSGASVVASRYLAPGARIRAEDIMVVNGDITKSPVDLVRTPTEAIGKAVSRPVTQGGQVLLNNLKEPAVIKIGEAVQVQITGRGFQATGEGVAVSGGAIGDSIRVRMPDGQQLTGQAVRQGVVEVVIH